MRAWPALPPSMLDQLPTEILLHVVSFLPARTLIRCLALVCRKFHELLSEEWVWRKRFIQQCRSTPLVGSLAGSSLRRLQQACVEVDFVAVARDQRQGSMIMEFLPGIDEVLTYQFILTSSVLLLLLLLLLFLFLFLFLFLSIHWWT